MAITFLPSLMWIGIIRDGDMSLGCVPNDPAERGLRIPNDCIPTNIHFIPWN